MLDRGPCVGIASHTQTGNHLDLRHALLGEAMQAVTSNGNHALFNHVALPVAGLGMGADLRNPAGADRTLHAPAPSPGSAPVTVCRRL